MFAEKKRRSLSKIIVHSSKSDIGTAKSITDLHIKDGKKVVGYHFIIERNGHIEKGRDVARVGEHLPGHNLDSIGICLIGKDEFTNDQLISFGTLMQALLSEYRDIQKVLRHKDITPDGCNLFESTWFDKPTDIIQ